MLCYKITRLIIEYRMNQFEALIFSTVKDRLEAEVAMSFVSCIR